MEGLFTQFAELNKHVQHIIIEYATSCKDTLTALRLVSKRCNTIATPRWLSLLFETNSFKFIGDLNRFTPQLVSLRTVHTYQSELGVSGVLLWFRVCRFYHIIGPSVMRELQEIKAFGKFNLKRLKRKRNALKVDIDDGIFGRGKRSKGESDEDWTFRTLKVCEKRIRRLEVLTKGNRKEELEACISNAMRDRHELSLLFRE